MALTKIPSSLLDTSGGFDLQGNITLGDNEQIQLGDSSDLAIYHDGSHSYIDDSGTGGLILKAGGTMQLNTPDDERMIRMVANDAVTLYYNNGNRIETTSAGATVTGTLTVTGDLDITGDINSYNVTDLDVTDQTITLGAGQTEANSGGSGIVVDGSGASILWDETNDQFDINKGLNVTGEAEFANKLKVYAENNALVAVDSLSNAYMVIDRSADNRRGALVFSTAAVDVFASPPATGTINWALGVGDSDELSGNKFAIKAGNTNFANAQFVIDTSGNVGIGTTSPSTYNTQLASFKDGGSFAYLGHSNTGGTFPKVSALSFGSNAVSFTHSTNGGTNALTGSAQIAAIQSASSNAPTDMAFYTTAGGIVAERMRISAGGNVGIGNTNPSGMHSNANKLVVGTGSGDQGMSVFAGTSTGRYAFARAVGNNTDAYDGGMAYDGDRNLTFHTNANSERMRIDGSGNVGIAGTPPSDTNTGYPLLSIGETTAIQGLNDSNESFFGNNAIWKSDNSWEYVKDVRAVQMAFADGTTIFRQAASGTAGNDITWSESMRITNTGNLLVNQNSAGVNGKLQVTGGIGLTGNSEIRQSTNSDGSTLRFLGTQFVAGSTNAVGYSYSSGAQIASVSNSANVILFEAGASNTSGHRLTIQNDATGLQGEVKYAGSEPVFILRDTRNAGGTAWSDSANEPLGEIEFWTSDATGIGPHAVARIRTVNDITAASPAGAITFMTSGYNNGSPTEKMRISSSGRLLVDTTSIGNASTNAKVVCDSEFLARGSSAGFFWENRSGMTISSQGGWGGWYSTGTASHFLYSDGANRASIGRTSGTYTALSDVNKKKDFEDSTVGLAEVMQLQPKKFRMLDDADDAPKKLGFVAQDVENVIPEAYVEDLADDENEETFIGLTDRPIIAALTKAIQELKTELDAAKARITELEG